MAEMRTTKQIAANDLDADIYRLAGRLLSAGYEAAAQHVVAARSDVRKDMHKADRADTDAGLYD